ncbi:MAG: tetratricopeptide repeat protein [Massilia sp.]
MNKLIWGGLTAIMILAGNAQAATGYCGDLSSHYGPFDYRKRAELNLEIVERFHFTDQVAKGIAGESGYLGGDLDYTLRVYPNHARALATLAMVAARTKEPQLQGAKFPTECYFERAVRFAPDDGTAYAAYGNYLNSQGKSERALDMLQRAVELEPENATFNYNLGLLYVKLRRYDKASQYADKAYSLGFPLPGLRNQLAEVRKGNSGAK